MNYFTKEELEEITNKLIESPTRETLKELNIKYNGEEKTDIPSMTETSIEIPSVSSNISEEVSILEPNVNLNTIPNNDMNSISIPSIEMPNNQESGSEQMVNINSIPNSEVNNVNIPNLNNDINTMPSIEIPNNQPNNNEQIINLNSIPNNNMNVSIPSFEVPNLNTPEVNNNINNINNPNVQAVNFNGNLWEPQNTTANNMMDTTDNFNIGIIGTPENNNVPINNNGFFVTNNEQVNNPIPITGNNNMQGPSMFGQFEQNYNNLNS